MHYFASYYWAADYWSSPYFLGGGGAGGSDHQSLEWTAELNRLHWSASCR